MISRRCLTWLAGLLCLAPAAAGAEPAGAHPSSVIVKLRGDGPHAVYDCAETLARRGEPFAAATADRSGSLDALHRELAVRSVRAIFRRPDGSPLAVQRRRLAQRFELARERRLERVRARRADLEAVPAARPLTAASGLEHVYRVELPAGADVGAAVARYAADPHVEYAQPNFIVANDLDLDDPFLGSQGTWGQAYADLWGLHRIGAPAAWERTQGEGVLVAVADTGIDYEHPDIADNLWINPGEDVGGNGAVDPEDWNGVDDDGNGFVDDLIGYDFFDSVDANRDGDYLDPADVGDPDPYDDNGHGTHVAGTVAAVGDNGIGIAGVAPRAQLMAVRVLGPAGSGETASVWRGVLYAAENGADVINASWSCSPRCPENPIAEQVVPLLIELGSVFVTSAGNRSSDVALLSPEKLRETIAVGNVGPGDVLSATSSFGFLMDVVAPGTDILSLRAAAAIFPPAASVGDGYVRLSGTSMAAPHVTGAVALLLSARPGLGYEEIRAILRLSAEDLGLPGIDRRFGSGLLRPDLALDATPPDARGAVLEPGPGEVLADARADATLVRARVEGDEIAAYAVELGVGSTPAAWLPLPDAGSDGADVLRRWEVASAADGPYVVRLRIEAADGRELLEFAPVALERSPPRLVSEAEVGAFRPVVSDGRVVWQVLSPLEGALDHDLVVGSVRGEAGSVIVATPDNSHGVVVSGARVAWQEGPLGPLTSEIRACTLHGRDPSCDPIVVAGGAVVRGRPSVSGRRIVYHEVEAGRLRLKLCELEPFGRGCLPRVVSPESVAPSRPFVDGRRLLWMDRRAGVPHLFTCLLDPRSGACPELATGVTSALGVIPVGLSGDLVAWYDLEFVPGGLRSQLQVCALDADTGDCPATQVASALDPFEMARLSGRRLVWHANTELDRPDVYFCVYAGGRCTPQQITSELGEQSSPGIDGRDVVWHDNRDGVQRIAALTLPELAPLRDRSAVAGERLDFDVRAEAPESRDVELSVATASGGSAKALGARLDPRGPRHARFRWRPRAEHVGEHVLVFRAERPGGLFDERAVRISVRAPTGAFTSARP